jgi:hypothetical protein
MSSTRITLNHLLGFDGVDLTPDRVPDLTSSEAYAALQTRLASRAGPMWNVVRQRIPEHLTKLLDIDGVGVLAGAWNKTRELRKYRDQTKYPPEDVIVVSLTKHTIESKHRPYLEIVAEEQPIGRLDFEIDLSLMLEGAELTVQAGRVKRIKPGKSTGTGTIKCEGAVLYSVDKKLLTLPGVIDLGEGVVIPA